MDNLELYNNEKIILEKTCPKIIIVWVVFVSTIILLFVFVITTFEYKKSKIYNAYLIKERGVCFATIYTEINKEIYRLHNLKIDNKKYQYNIYNIDNYHVDKNKIYGEVTLEIKDCKNLKENEIVNIEFNLGKTKIINEIAKKIEMELKLWKN